MKKTKLTRSLLAACSIVALTAVMYGCVHDGGSDTPTTDDTDMTMPDPMPDPEPMAVSVTLPADLMYLEAADMPMAGETTIAAGMSHTSGGVVFSCAAGGEDCMLTVAADGTASYLDSGGAVTAALNDGAQMRADEAKATQMVTARDRIIGIDRALEVATNIAATGSATALGEDTISISRAAGAAASVAVTNPPGYAASATPAMSNGGWTGARLMRPVTGATQHLVVYTDIGPPTRIQFYNWDGDTTTPARYGDNTATAVTTATALTLADVGGGVSGLTRGNLDPKFMSPGPAAGGSVTQRFPTATATATSLTFQGNYNGAPGTYTCNGASGGACTMTISPTGTYTPATGQSWTFTPELRATAWQRDADFISFGWWLQEPASANGTYTFQYYADGSSAFAAPTAISAGTATYSGRAAGQYVVQEQGDGGVTGGTASQFTAAATLTANFSAAANSISGSIHDFTGEDVDDHLKPRLFDHMRS